MELGGGPAESFGPGEGASGAPEQLSEEAKQRFAASAAAMQQIRREEKKSKKKDDHVAQAIIKFLSAQDHAHLFLLISRLVARDCPSIFILAILSLIDEGAKTQVAEYLSERTETLPSQMVDAGMSLTKSGELDSESNRVLVEWITRMQMVLSLDAETILIKLMVDEKNIDGSVLQLSAFVLQEFFKSTGRTAEFAKLQPLTAGILQAVFEPFMKRARKQLRENAPHVEE